VKLTADRLNEELAFNGKEGPELRDDVSLSMPSIPGRFPDF